MNPDQKVVRTAGFLYLTMIVVTAASYGTTMTLTAGDPLSASAKLRDSLVPFQLAIVGFGVGMIAYVFLGLWLYRIFRSIHEGMAMMLLVLVSIHAAISLAGIAPLLDAVALIRGPALVDVAQLPGQVAMKMLSFNTTWRVSFIFSGLWLYPLGWLGYRSAFVPKWIGMAAMVGSVSYVLAFAGWVLQADYDNTPIGRAVGVVSGVPSLVGEMGTCISLLVAGFRLRGR